MEKTNNIVDLFEETTEKKVTKLDDTQLETLSENITRFLRIGGMIGNTEERLRKLKEQYRQLSEEDLPQKMAELGMQDLRLEDGSRITIDMFYATRINQNNRDAAHDWLREQGHGDIIKNVVSVTFGKGEDDTALETVTLLEQEGLLPDQKESVHPSTLKAFVKERIESGDNAFTPETQKLFSVYQGKRTKITK
jgi:hypothetical protein|tara:strand:+ start:1649 stop:2230 length:582 start_codon:yes stop_codon:yes gene_type:complete